VIVAGAAIKWQNYSGQAIYLCTIGYFIPLVLICAAYIAISVIVKRSPRNVISPRDNSRINRSICVVIGLFVACWAPYVITSILADTCCFEYIVTHLWMRSFFKWLHYSNSCINPVVYGIANAQYKEAFRDVFRKITSQCIYKYRGTESLQPSPLACTFPAIKDYSKDNDEKALFVDLNAEEKHSIEINETKEVYLAGDYRALPAFQTPKTNRKDMNGSAGSVLATPRMNRRETSSIENILCTPRLCRKERNSSENSGSPRTGRKDKNPFECVLPAPTVVETDVLSENMLSGSSFIDDSFALQQALLNPESLRRTSYL